MKELPRKKYRRSTAIDDCAVLGALRIQLALNERTAIQFIHLRLRADDLLGPACPDEQQCRVRLVIPRRRLDKSPRGSRGADVESHSSGRLAVKNYPPLARSPVNPLKKAVREIITYGEFFHETDVPAPMSKRPIDLPQARSQRRRPDITAGTEGSVGSRWPLVTDG